MVQFETRLDNVAVKMPSDGGRGSEGLDGSDTIRIGQLLLLFTGTFTNQPRGGVESTGRYQKHEADTLELAFVWWYTLNEEEYESDCTGCKVYDRSYQRRPEGGNNKLVSRPWTEVETAQLIERA
jgi:hypothetical protein